MENEKRRFFAADFWVLGGILRVVFGFFEALSGYSKFAFWDFGPFFENLFHGEFWAFTAYNSQRLLRPAVFSR